MYLHWSLAIPLQDISAATVTTAFVREWVSRYGIPERLKFDRGRQFTSNLFAELTQVLGIHHCKTTAYHPIANGALERWHRSLKAALMCVGGDWLDSLPLVLLGLRTALRTDSNVSASQLAFGTNLRVPGMLLWDGGKEVEETNATEGYIQTLRAAVEQLKHVPFLHKRDIPVFIAPELATCSHVFVCEDAARSPLQRPYKGPYRILHRRGKTLVLDYGTDERKVSIDRVKPAFLLAMEVEQASSPPVQPLSPEAAPFSPSEQTPYSSQPSTSMGSQSWSSPFPNSSPILIPRATTPSSPPSTQLRGILRTSPATEQDTRRVLFDELSGATSGEPDKRPYERKLYVPRSFHQEVGTRSGRMVKPPMRFADMGQAQCN